MGYRTLLPIHQAIPWHRHPLRKNRAQFLGGVAAGVRAGLAQMRTRPRRSLRNFSILRTKFSKLRTTFFNLTPGPSPFSSTKITPADSRGSIEIVCRCEFSIDQCLGASLKIGAHCAKSF